MNRKKDDSEFYRTMPKTMKWPPAKEMQQKFRENARSGHCFPDLMHLVPNYDAEITCKLHGEKFDGRDPVKMLWVLSRKVVIYNADWVPSKNRVVYYRPTENRKCDCKITWTGEEHLLLNVNKGQCGKTTHLVTYNLLLTYTMTSPRQAQPSEDILHPTTEDL